MERDNRQERHDAARPPEIKLKTGASLLALWALVLPILVLTVILAHASWLNWAGALTTQERAASRIELGQLTLTPSGRPPREGPSSHDAIDRRHGPGMPQPHSSPGGELR